MKDLGEWVGDPALLREALTHSSYAHEHQPPLPHNERLEFLGDAVLSLVVSHVLYREHPDWDEGRLTQTRAWLVREATLAEAARRLGIGGRLRLGRGERLTGGQQKASLLADAFEAVTAAVYLTGGLAAADAFVAAALARELEEARTAFARHDYKTTLNERLVRIGKAARYQLVGEFGPDHAKHFVMAVVVDGEEWARAEGRSKKEAEQEAARSALSRLDTAVRPSS
jgi:ribonuclease-3